MRGPFDVKSFALTGLFILATAYTFYFGRAFFRPIVLALLLSYLLTPAVRVLRKLRIPAGFGAAIVMLTLLGIIASLGVWLSTPAAAWIEKAPYSLHKLQEKLVPLKVPMTRVSEASAEIDKITDSAPDAKKPTVVQMKNTRLHDAVFTQTPEIIASTIATVILLFFLLASDGMFLRKMIKVIPRFEDKKRAVEIARDIEGCISRYLVTVTLINVCLGACVALSMYLLGMPNPFLWGVMVACLHFIPYLGAIVGLIAMTLAAMLTFDNLSWALVVPGTYLVFAIIEANFVTPMVIGRSLTLNPIVILIGLMFWGWIWGVPGTLLAVPILATFKILCDHIKPLANIGEFFSD